MKYSIEKVYEDKDFCKLFELLVDNKIEEIIQKVKQDNKARYDNKEYHPSTRTNGKVDEKDE